MIIPSFMGKAVQTIMGKAVQTALCILGLIHCQVGGPLPGSPLPHNNQPSRAPKTILVPRSSPPDVVRAKPPTLAKKQQPTLKQLPAFVEVQVLPIPAAPRLMPFGLSIPSRQVFDRFFSQLDRLKNGQARKARVSFWGASHMAGEAFTGQMRQRLQTSFGDAGPGFVLLGRPWPSYRHSTVKFGTSPNWRPERIWNRYQGNHFRPRDNLFGLAGISVTGGKDAFTWLEPRKDRVLAALDLYYLRQPKGGRLNLSADGQPVQHFLTMAHRKEAAFARLDLPPGTRRITFGITSGEVRIFGVDLDSGSPGVVCDTFGINGARSNSILQWNIALTELQLKRLQPDLIVMAYGSNSVDNKRLTPPLFAKSFDAVVQRMQNMAPGADCLVIGPGDQARRSKSKEWTIPAQLDWIIEVEREVALQRGCAFWDWRSVMGGPQSIYSWIKTTPPLASPDHLHFTIKGYQALANALYESLMALFHSRS